MRRVSPIRAPQRFIPGIPQAAGDPVDRQQAEARELLIRIGAGLGAGAPRRRRLSSSIWMNDSGSTYGLRRSIEACSTGSESSSRVPPRIAISSARVSSSSASSTPQMRSRAGDVVPQRHVAPGDPRVGLAAAHLGVGDQRGEERPLRRHLLQRLQAVALARLAQRGPETEPGGQHDPRLGPGEHPRDRAQLVDPAGGLAPRRDASRVAAARPPRPAWR